MCASVVTPPAADLRPPRMLDAASLLAEAADEVVVASVRDTHRAVATRVFSLVNPLTAGFARPVDAVHGAIAAGTYAGISAGIRSTSWGLAKLAEYDLGPEFERDGRERSVSAAVNGLIGDRIARERPHLAIRMSVRAHGRDVPVDATGLEAAFPAATRRMVVFLHGLCEDETNWSRDQQSRQATYADSLAARGWTPVMIRANTGLSIRRNGVEFAALMQELVDNWPTEVSRIALIGHSMGGLIMRAATGIASEHTWVGRVSNQVTLGSPHLGSTVAVGASRGSAWLRKFPETRGISNVLDQRSEGIEDLVHGLRSECPAPAHIRFHLVAATLTAAPHHLLGDHIGDLLVTSASAYGRPRRHHRSGATTGLFPDADVVHVGGTNHFGLLNHADVDQQLVRWLD